MSYISKVVRYGIVAAAIAITPGFAQTGTRTPARESGARAAAPMGYAQSGQNAVPQNPNLTGTPTNSANGAGNHPPLNRDGVANQPNGQNQPAAGAPPNSPGTNANGYNGSSATTSPYTQGGLNNAAPPLDSPGKYPYPQKRESSGPGYGWFGLVGLVGLVGLFRGRRRNQVNTTQVDEIETSKVIPR